MQEPCRSCSRQAVDFGGCRCQAFLLTAHGATTDPVSYLAPQHRAVAEVLQTVNDNAADTPNESRPDFAYRRMSDVPILNPS